MSAACLFIVGGQAVAVGNIEVMNPSFEDDPLADNTWQFGAIGWTGADFGAWNPPAYIFPGGAPFGENVIWTWPGGSLSQILTTPLVDGFEYTLEVAVGHRGDHFFLSDYQIELWAGAELLAWQENGVTPEPGTFADTSLTYLSTGNDGGIGELLEIRLINFAPLSELGLSQAVFDDIRLTASPVPAPGALALLGIGAFHRRRRRG